MTRALRLLARMATAILGGYCAQGLTAIADTACNATHAHVRCSHSTACSVPAICQQTWHVALCTVWHVMSSETCQVSKRLCSGIN